MAVADELAQASAASKMAFDHWVAVQQQTNDKNTIGAAKANMDAANLRELALKSAAKPLPTAGAAADQLHPATPAPPSNPLAKLFGF